MRGVIADVNIQGQVDDLIRLLETDPWRIFWLDLQISYVHFSDVGLANETPDSKVWRVCQDEQLVLITDNRNQKDPDSLETTIRAKSTPDSLPVFTISSVPRLHASRDYAIRVAEKMLDFLERIDSFRGTGRLYLP